MISRAAGRESVQSSFLWRVPRVCFGLLLGWGLFAWTLSVEAQLLGDAGYYTEEELSRLTPTTPNPYLAFLPGGIEPDWDYWRSYIKIQGEKRRAAFPVLRLVPLAESEPNDTQGTADVVAGFGSGADPSADVTGSFSAPPAPSVIGSPTEDDGDIAAAKATGLSPGSAITTSAVLGDGPFGFSGAGTGDFDFYAVTTTAAGQIIVADIDTFDNGFTFDSFLALWDSAGTLLATVDDEDFGSFIFDSLLEYSAPSAGTYYISVGASTSPIPLDPFDSSSGLGIGTEGAYDITIGLDPWDADYFSVALQAGDILGANVLGDARQVGLFHTSGALRVASQQDLSGIFPGASPLPGGGSASLFYVIEEAGTYAARVSGPTGSYTLELRVFRPAFEGDDTAVRQVLFLDFDGASLDVSIFAGASGVKNLSPLSAFLVDWGLTLGDENAVIDAVVASVEENLKTDLLFPDGNNPGFEIELRNSRDHADLFGQPNVSRVIVGGTVSETGMIGVIGIAQSTDVGNFETEETAIVLLDALSAVSLGFPDFENTLNGFSVQAPATKVDLVGVGLGNIISREAGHFFGNFHTENFVTAPNLMDQGGNMANTVGVGVDLVFGSGDDTDVDFGPDAYMPNEGFAGTEDTLNTVAFGLTGGDSSTLYADLDASTNGWGVLAFPFNTLSAGVAAAPSGATIRLLPSTTAETFTAGGALNRAVTLVNHNPGGGVVRIGAP